MKPRTEERTQRYSNRVEVGADFIELHIGLEPVELTWEWRLYERHTDTRAHKFKTFGEAKRAGLIAVLKRIEQRTNEWAEEFDRIEKETLR